MFGHSSVRRALALLGCLALLYFAAGSVVHHHTGGPDTACHICQVLHVPALAVAPVTLIPETGQVVFHASVSEAIIPSDSFALHRASRAPPQV